MRWLTFTLMSLLLFPSTLFAQPSSKQLDNLAKLAIFLDEKVDSKHFDIDRWGNTPNPDDPNYSGCVGGYSTKLFAKEGFHYHGIYPAYKDKIGFPAISEFFGLNQEETYFLFSDRGKAGRNPHKAAANIRMIVNKHRKERFELTIASAF